MNFIDLDAQYRALKPKIDARIQTVLDRGTYIMGPEVFELEEKLAEYVGVKHAISCANGTDALSLALMALEIGPGDAVFCPTFTFFATGEAIARQGALPIFVDSDANTFNMCANDLRQKIEATLAKRDVAPKAIMPVDLFGLPADYPKLDDIAQDYGLKIIEDAAQGFGGAIRGRRAGSFGDISTTSFFPAKPLGCYGDGGAVFTNDDYYAELIKSYRIHGKGASKYDNVRIGVNSRLDTIQAAILLEKLVAFPAELENRNIAAERYMRSLPDNLKLPVVPAGFYSSWAQFTVVSENRSEARQEFHKQQIPTMVYYERCLHEQSAFCDLGHRSGDFPVAEHLSASVFSLPMHGYL